MSVDPVSLAVEAGLFALNTALTASQHFEGPRLTDLSVTTADYGAPLNYVYGVRRLDGISCIWAEPLKEVKVKHKTKGGKFNDYTYFGTWAVVLCDHEISSVTKIWFDRNLVYDVTGPGPISPFADIHDITQYFRIYLGTTTQHVDPRMSATLDAKYGAGSTPAYRGVAYIVFQEVPLEKLGNRMPQVSVEVTALSAGTHPLEHLAALSGSPISNLSGVTFSPDGSRVLWGWQGAYEIWDVATRTPMISGTFQYTPLDTAIFGQPSMAVTNDGTIYLCAYYNEPLSRALYSYSPDGTGTQNLIGEWFAAYEPFALQGIALDEYVGVSSDSISVDGAFYTVGGAFEVLDTLAHTGVAWQVKFYFADLDGNIWAMGAEGSSDVLWLWQVGPVPGAAYPVTMPDSNGPVVACGAYHYRDANVDHFVVYWGSTYLLTIDASSFAVTQTRAYSVPGTSAHLAFKSIVPGASAIWLSPAQISSADLSTLRSVDLTDWGLGSSGVSAVFVPKLNALMAGDGTDFVEFIYLDRVSGDGVTLQSIVEDVSARCGLEMDDYDATDLSQTVTGYSWTQGTGKAILDPLLEAYDSEGRPHDFQVQFLRRGRAVLGSIPVGDMGAGGGDRYQVPETLDTDLPLKVNFTFADIARDQQSNTAIAQRAGASTDSKRELSLDGTTLALGADEARQIADGYLRRSWIKAQTASLAVSRAYSKLEPGDAYALAFDDVALNMKLTRLEFGANGVLTTEWERYAVSVHAASALVGAPGDGLTSQTVPVFGYTKGLALDIPLARDADDGLITYLAAAPYSPSVAWPGAAFWRSDEGSDYVAGFGDVASTQAATIGYALSALPDALATCWDNASSVSVKMFDGELASATKAAVANGANRALLGEEIIGFTTATLIAANTYQLSGLHRGRRGTEWATGGHVMGERFVLLANLPVAAMGASDVGDSFYVKPITNGGSSGFPQHLDPYTGASRKPYAPAHLAVADASGDLVATWTRRTRIGGTWRDFQDVPLGEGSEAYVGQVLNGAGAVIRTFAGLTSPTLTYTAAQQATDSGAGATLRVMQVSATVGNGFAADVAL